MTVEVVMLDRDGALELTERIRVALDRVSTAWADLAERIAEAYERRADLALGYSSWAEYAEAELRPSEGIAADVRRQLVAVLSAQGMSTRAIAPTVGVSQRQISTDVRSDFSPAEPESIDLATGEVLVPPHPQARLAPWPERRDETGGGGVVVIDPKTGEIHQGSDEAVAHITGLDGKTYSRPEPKAAPTTRRRALSDQFFAATYDLGRRVEAMRRLAADDRFTRNANEIAQKHLSDLVHSRDLDQQAPARGAPMTRILAVGWSCLILAAAIPALATDAALILATILAQVVAVAVLVLAAIILPTMARDVLTTPAADLLDDPTTTRETAS